MSRKQRTVRMSARVKEVNFTEWSQPMFTPTRHGVYEVKADDGTPHRQFSYYDDAGWYAGATTPEDARQNARLGHLRSNQQVTWRGIVK
jgi:hypothetical protein